MGMLSLVMDYAGLIVGAVLLILASSVLPGKVRWYVLTAGLAVIAWEGYQRYTNRKRLAEADAERHQLRERFKSMEKERLALAEEVGKLSEELESIEERKLQLDDDLEGLIGEGDELARKREELEQEVSQLLEKNAAVVAQIDSRQDALATIDGVDDVFRQFDEAMESSQ